MDEHAFQEELRHLKQRVSEMSLSSQQRQRQHLEQSLIAQPYLSPYTPSSFSNLVTDIRTQLESMQRTVAAQIEHEAAWRQQTSASAGPDAAQANILLPPHAGFGGPSTPIYWQLYSALKNDVQLIDEKVANLEDSYSALEDRVEALEPPGFTPPGSEVGSETSSISNRPHAQDAAPLEAQAASEASSKDGPAKDLAAKSADGLPSAGLPEQATSGVAFRDKEIYALEELLRRSHEVNKMNEATLEAKDREIARLETRAEELRTRTGDAESSERLMGQAHLRCSDEIDRRDSTIQRLTAELRDFKASRHHFMTKYVDENYRYKWLKQKKIQSEHGLQRRIDELEQALSDMDDRKVAAHDSELEKLQTFCSQKDAVIYRQEEIIARGAKIIQQRDAEIGHLQGRFDEIDKERAFSRDQRALLLSTQRQRDATIEELQHEVQRGAIRQQKLDSDRFRNLKLAQRARIMYEEARDEQQAREEEAQPLDRASQAVGGGKNVTESTRWAPEPIPEYAGLPHEGNRAPVWRQSMPNAAKPSFVASGPMGPADKQLRPGPYRAVRRSMPLDRDAEDVEEQSRLEQQEPRQRGGSQSARQQSDQHKDRSNGVNDKERATNSDLNAARGINRPPRPNWNSLPIDATFWPPLPAPVPAEGRRVESVPNLRGASRAQAPLNSRTAIAKPASMEQLPRRRLQAYVEEDEGGDDRGDSSLLD